MKDKIYNKSITLSKKELLKIKDLCKAFQEIVNIVKDSTCIDDPLEAYDRYYQIVDIIQNFNDNWG